MVKWGYLTRFSGCRIIRKIQVHDPISLAFGTSPESLSASVRVSAAPREDHSTQLAMEYCTDQFDPPWADRFLRCVAHLLEHAAAAPGTPVADLPMLSALERDALIIGRNRQPRPGKVDRAALPAPQWGAQASAAGAEYLAT